MVYVAVQAKTCAKCGKEKPATAEYFHRDKSSKDGLVYQCKICVGKRVKEWAKKNPEKVRENQQRWNNKNPGVSAARSKKWRENNPEKYKESLRRWYQNNREKSRMQSKKWYQLNREAHYQQGLRWYKNNLEKARAISRKAARKYKKLNPEKVKQWQQNNPELVRAYCQQYRARKRKLSDTLTVNQWKACKEYFNHSCAYCGKHLKRLHQEHFVPVSKGGGYTANNIIPACKSCNSSKKDSDFFDWYPTRPFYSKLREKRILKYLNYDKLGRQQASILELVKEEA